MSIVTWANVGVALTSLAAIIISLITWKKRDQQKIERDKKEAYERCNADYITAFDLPLGIYGHGISFKSLKNINAHKNIKDTEKWGVLLNKIKV